MNLIDRIKTSKYKKLWYALAILLLLALLFYFYTTFFSKKHDKVIYEDVHRRIYLNEKKEYKKGREMWRLVYEDQKTGTRYFVMGNSPKGFSNAKMSRIILNTIDKGQLKSFDQVERVGITMKKANTDIHSNLIGKKELLNWDGLEIPEELALSK